MAIAKQAARVVLEDLDVAVVQPYNSGRWYRTASGFTKLLDDLQTARNPADLKQKLLAPKDKDQILIDTSGINPFQHKDMTCQRGSLRRATIEPITIVAAAGDANETGKWPAFSALGVRRMATRLDMARRLGLCCRPARRTCLCG